MEDESVEFFKLKIARIKSDPYVDRISVATSRCLKQSKGH